MFVIRLLLLLTLACAAYSLTESLQDSRISIPMIMPNATRAASKRGVNQITCGSYSCGSDSFSCCTSSANPCCTLSVGSGVCCPDECYTSNVYTCCNPGGCTAAYPTCCAGSCCAASATCVSGSCVTDSSPPPPSDSSSDSDLSPGAIAGIVVGSAVGFVAAIVGIVCGVKRRDQEMVSQGLDTMNTTISNLTSS